MPKTARQEIEWYAVHTRARHEFIAATNLKRLGYWTWLPFERVKRTYKRPNSTVRTIRWEERPYYTRYLFVALRFEEDNFADIHSANGVSTVVKAPLTGLPLQIPGAAMDELMERADERGEVGVVDEVAVRARDRFIKGQKVRFRDDHVLSGLIAEVAVDAGREVRIFLEVLGSRRDVSVDPQHIKAAS